MGFHQLRTVFYLDITLAAVPEKTSAVSARCVTVVVPNQARNRRNRKLGLHSLHPDVALLSPTRNFHQITA